MTHFDKIYEIAADNYGLITFGEAKEVGVPGEDLNRFVKDGRLERLGHGVYKLTKYIPTPYDQYAEAVTLVGPGAYIHSESVLAMHNPALVNPSKTTVATPKRTRERLPGWIEVVPVKGGEKVTNYEGIPSQSVADALRYCKGRVMKERLTDAAQAALHEGLIDEVVKAQLKEELDL